MVEFLGYCGLFKVFQYFLSYEIAFCMKRKNSDKEVKEPVKIRLKELKSGSKSIYLDCYVNGVRGYKFLILYLRPEVSR